MTTSSSNLFSSTAERRYWRALKPGDRVDVIAPASKGPMDELEQGIKVLESWGLKVRVSPQLFAPHLLHSNSDEERWKQLKESLYDSDAAAVWCVRGGYGSMKLLPPLMKLPPPPSTKIFLGLSDITSLHVFFNQHWNWPVLHAPVLTRIGRGDLPQQSINELKQVLFGEVRELKYTLKPLNTTAEGVENWQAPLVGGNWTTLMAGFGTPAQINGSGVILFLEDIGERGYRLDRYWEQMLQAGLLDQIQGIIFGDFTLGDEPDGKNYVWDVLQKRAQDYAKPVFAGIPAGHGLIQRVLPLGVPVQVRQGESILPTGVL